MTKRILLSMGLALALTAAAERALAQEVPAMAKPTKEHELLAQFAGKWTSSATMEMPGGEALTCNGVEDSRMMGGLWLVVVGEGEMPDGGKGESMITLGYDPAKKTYVGTFVCSAQDIMWVYTGKFDETGKKLILLTDGPSMIEPGKTAKYEETMELVDADHKTFTSKIQLPDGTWMELVKVTYERVK
jgi:hypothetical protein